ncbi:MAG: hypothetical protein ABIA63_05880 [bacterium]
MKTFNYWLFSAPLLIVTLLHICVSSQNIFSGWQWASGSTADPEAEDWNKYIDYYKPNSVFAYTYSLPAMIEDTAINRTAHDFNDSLFKRGISWYVYSITDIIEKGSLPVSEADWQLQRNMYDSLFNEFPAVDGVIMNWFSSTKPGNRLGFVQKMVNEFRTVFEPRGKILLFRFYRFVYSTQEIISVFGDIKEPWVGYFPKEPDSDFGMYHGHSPVLEQFGPDELVIAEFDLMGEAWTRGRLTWIPLPFLRKSRAFFNKWGIEGGVTRMMFKSDGGNAGFHNKFGEPFNLHEANYTLFHKIMPDTNLAVTDKEIYDEFLNRRFGFAPGSELCSIAGSAISRSYFTLVKAGWTEPLTREQPNYMPDGEWGAITIADEPMTAQRARYILQEKEDSWQMAQATWNELFSVQSQMDAFAWNAFRENIYRNYLISMSSRFEAEARVELARATTAGITPNWPTIKYAIDQLKIMQAEYATIARSYTGGKDDAAGACISEIEPQIPAGTVAALAQGPYLFNKSWVQTADNELTFSWESQAAGKSFLEYCEDTTGWLSNFSYKPTPLSSVSSTSHEVVLSGLTPKTCYFFKMVTIADNGNTLRSSEFYHTLLTKNPVSAQQWKIASPSSDNYLNVSPSPFNGRTSFIFSIPSRQKVMLKIFNPRGELVETLLNRQMKSGSHRIPWNTEYHQSGMFIVKLKSNKISYSDKFYLVK